MTDLQFQIVSFVHDPPVDFIPRTAETLNHFLASGVPLNEASRALHDLQTLNYLHAPVSTGILEVTALGLEKLDDARDLRRRETLLQQQLHAQREEQKARDERYSQQKALDQKISKLAILFAVVTGLIAPVISVLAAHLLPLWLWP